MRARVWLTSLVLAAFAVACGDQPTEVVPERDGGMAQGPGAIALATSSTEDGLSITTDKDDYAPGDTVWFTGAGWPANDVLDIVLTDDPTHDQHEWTVEVGADGTFRDSTYVVDINDLGVTFTLTATSRGTGRSLTVVFTDNPNPTLTQVEVYEVTGCTSASPTPLVPALNHAACARVSISNQGGGTPAEFHFQWVDPNGSVVRVQDRTGPTGAVRTDTLPAALVTASGSWTVRTCKGNTPNLATTPCTGGNLTTSSSPRSFTVPAAPGNDPPDVDGGGPYTVVEGTTLTLSPTVSDPDGDALTYKWTVNTADIDAGGTCTFDDDEVKDAKVTCTDDSDAATGDKFTLSLTVNDGQGHEVSDNADLTVTNANPTGNAGGPYSTAEGAGIQLAGSGDDPGDNDDAGLMYQWTVDASGIDPGGTCTFDDATKKDAKVTCTDDSGGGTFTLSLVVQDDDGGTSSAATAALTVVNAIPVSLPGGDYSGSEGAGIQLSGAANDAGSNDTHSFMWSYQAVVADPGATCSFSDASASSPTVTCTDDGLYKLTLQVTDDDGDSDANDAVLTLSNVNPVLGAITAPLAPVNIATPVNVSASFTDAGTNDTHTGIIDWGDLSTSPAAITEAAGAGAAGGSHTYGSPGVYTVKMTVTDDDGGTSNESVFQYVVVYDPSAGFVTGGGWINSPPGAYTPDNPSDPDITGKATFGFVSRYQKGANVPAGNTEFQFHAANLNFKSTAYQWLVVQGGSGKASYKGDGTINGTGSYGFLLAVVDAGSSGDKFRIKIWDKVTNTIVYDNQVGSGDDAAATQLISGGSIVIHAK